MADETPKALLEPEEDEASAGGELTARQQNAIAALLLCPTIRGASEKSGIPESSLYRWLRSSAFQEAYREARETSLQQAISMLQSATGAAVGVMLSLMADKKSAATVRLASARSVLEYAFKAKEMQEIEERLQALEQALTASRERTGGYRR